MGSNRKPRIGEGQRALLFEKPSIPLEYEEILARRAAQRRNRRIGELSVGRTITAGFRSRTMGLWVPFSQAENTAVVSPPNAQLIQGRIVNRARVNDKYQDSGVDQRKVERWAKFASERAFRQSMSKYVSYFQAAKQHLLGLESGLNPDRSYDHDSIMRDYRPLYWMREYAIALRSYGEHKWVRPRWTKKRAIAEAQGSEFLSRLNDDQMLDFYDETVWNAWARKNYWLPKAYPPNDYDPTQDPRYQYPIELVAPPDPDDVEYYDDNGPDYPPEVA